MGSAILIIPLALGVLAGVIGVVLYLRLASDDRRRFGSLVGLILPWIPIMHAVAAFYWRRMP